LLLLKRSVIALVLLDAEVVFFQLDVGPIGVLANQHPNRAVLVFKALPVFLKHFGRKDVIAKVSVLVLGKKH
jgi:hypothetical protein